MSLEFGQAAWRQARRNHEIGCRAKPAAGDQLFSYPRSRNTSYLRTLRQTMLGHLDPTEPMGFEERIIEHDLPSGRGRAREPR